MQHSVTGIFAYFANRNIKTSNAAFQQRVAAAAGGIEFLELCGFKVSAGVTVVLHLHVELAFCDSGQCMVRCALYSHR